MNAPPRFEDVPADVIAKTAPGTTGAPLETVRVASGTQAVDEMVVKPPQPQLQMPSIGRVVHYVLGHNDLLTIGGQVKNAGKHRPAHIVEVHHQEDGSVTCDLAVMLGANDGPSVIALFGDVSEGFGHDTWHWPERV